MVALDRKAQAGFALARLISSCNIMDNRDASQSKENNRRRTDSELRAAKEHNQLAQITLDTFKDAYENHKEEFAALFEQFNIDPEDPKRGFNETMLGAKTHVSGMKNGFDSLENNKLLAAAMPLLKTAGLWRGNKAGGYRKEIKAILNLVFQLHVDAELKVFETYDYSVSYKQYLNTIEFTKDTRKEQRAAGVPEKDLVSVDLRIPIMTPDWDKLNIPEDQKAWPRAYYKNVIRELLEASVEVDENGKKTCAATAVTLKDALGLFQGENKGIEDIKIKEALALAKVAREAIEEFCEAHNIDSNTIDLQWHSHGETPNLHAALYKEGVKLDVCNGSLAGGTSHTRLLNLIKKQMADEGFSPEDYQDHPLYQQVLEIEKVIDQETVLYKKFRRTPEQDLTIQEIDYAKVGGGASSYFMDELLRVSKEKFGEDHEKIFHDLKMFTLQFSRQIWLDTGEPQYVTPGSKNFTDAAINDAVTALKKLREEGRHDDIKKASAAIYTSINDRGVNAEGTIKCRYRDPELQEDKDIALNSRPAISNLLTLAVMHATGAFDEKNRGYFVDGDIALRNSLLCARTFEGYLSEKNNDMNFLGQLGKTGAITPEQEAQIRELTLGGTVEMQVKKLCDFATQNKLGKNLATAINKVTKSNTYTENLSTPKAIIEYIKTAYPKSEDAFADFLNDVKAKLPLTHRKLRNYQPLEEEIPGVRELVEAYKDREKLNKLREKIIKRELTANELEERHEYLSDPRPEEKFANELEFRDYQRTLEKKAQYFEIDAIDNLLAVFKQMGSEQGYTKKDGTVIKISPEAAEKLCLSITSGEVLIEERQIDKMKIAYEAAHEEIQKLIASLPKGKKLEEVLDPKYLIATSAPDSQLLVDLDGNILPSKMPIKGNDRLAINMERVVGTFVLYPDDTGRSLFRYEHNGNVIEPGMKIEPVAILSDSIMGNIEEIVRLSVLIENQSEILASRTHNPIIIKAENFVERHLQEKEKWTKAEAAKKEEWIQGKISDAHKKKKGFYIPSREDLENQYPHKDITYPYDDKLVEAQAFLKEKKDGYIELGKMITANREELLSLKRQIPQLITEQLRAEGYSEEELKQGRPLHREYTKEAERLIKGKIRQLDGKEVSWEKPNKEPNTKVTGNIEPAYSKEALAKKILSTDTANARFSASL